ncbi:phosphoribosyltransferase-like protein [Alloalcanivorax venustensis]|uniref:phosphoribosyltransferase-like protein n=1 Tax=Alloalcanivorax venustensis TaxID=172371 RepID=UPI00351197A6
MTIEDIPQIKDWLSQFDHSLPDKYLAKYMLKKMRYVSFNEVEEWLQTSIEQLIRDIEKEDGKRSPIAIFPVSKPFINPFNEGKEVKPANDSAGRIAHSLKNLERRLPQNVEVTPRVQSMYDRRVKHIIYVDDFIGTGNRCIKSWRKTVSRRVKSWCSHGWCKIWVLSFAAHKSGINHITNQIRPINKDRFRVNLVIDKSFIIDNIELAKMSYRYGNRLGKSSVGLGYGKLVSPVVFQHGCPNNVPGIFWSYGKKGRKSWKPLFPERSVSVDLYPLFNSDLTAETTAEELWMVGHHKLAVEIIDEISNYKGRHQLIMILGFLEKGKSIEKIRNVLVLSQVELDEKLHELQEYGLIGINNYPTQFGLDILKRGEKNKRIKQDKRFDRENFYPASFLGFQREV